MTGETATGSRVWRNTRLVAVTVVGSVLVLAGLALMVLPGPGIPLLIGGLAVLASEYAWARRHLDRAKSAAATATRKVRRKAGGQDEGV